MDPACHRIQLQRQNTETRRAGDAEVFTLQKHNEWNGPAVSTKKTFFLFCRAGEEYISQTSVIRTFKSSNVSHCLNAMVTPKPSERLAN